MPLARSCGNLSIDGFFPPLDVSVLDIVAFGKRSHPGDTDTCLQSGFTVAAFRPSPNFAGVFSVLLSYAISHISKLFRTIPRTPLEISDFVFSNFRPSSSFSFLRSFIFLLSLVESVFSVYLTLRPFHMFGNVYALPNVLLSNYVRARSRMYVLPCTCMHAMSNGQWYTHAVLVYISSSLGLNPVGE